MNKYVKNPIEIEAIQLLNDGESIMSVWGFLNPSLIAVSHAVIDEAKAFGGINMATTKGIVKASFGDWVIKQNDTDFYPCSDEVFQQNYKAAPSTFLDRLKVELTEVQTRLDGLNKTLDVEARPSFISETQWAFMSRQQFHMRMYAQIIGQRIDEAEGKPVFINKRLVQLEGSETNLT